MNFALEEHQTLPYAVEGISWELEFGLEKLELGLGLYFSFLSLSENSSKTQFCSKINKASSILPSICPYFSLMDTLYS